MHKTSLLALYVLFPLLLTGLLLGCSRSELDFSVSDLPPGDPSHGAELFTQRVGSTASCASCHPLEGRAGAGPSLAGYGDYAAGRAGKQTPEQYAFDALLRPSKDLTQGFSNLMPSNYAELLSRQDIADLIAYLLAL